MAEFEDYLPATPLSGDELTVILQNGRTRKLQIGSYLGVGAQIDVRQFGAVGDGITNDAAALNAAAEYALENGLKLIIPAKDFFVGTSTVTFYTDVECYGRIVATNTSADTAVVTIDTDASDTERLTAAHVSGWGNFSKGQTVISAATDKRGWYYMFGDSAQVNIYREGGAPLYKYITFQIDTDDGHISPPLQVAMTNSGAATFTGVRKRIREPITVEGLVVQFTSGTGERESAIRVKRPNTVLRKCAVLNESGAPVQQGFETYQAAQVLYDRCVVRDLGVTNTNYGYAVGGDSIFVTLRDCEESGCRRGADASRGRMVTVRGGHFPSGIGAHWCDGMLIDGGAYVAGSNTANPFPIHYSGSNLEIGAATLVRYTNVPFINMREDYPEISGYLRTSTLTQFVETVESAAAIDDSISILVDLRTRGYSPAYDPGRTIEAPREIRIDGQYDGRSLAASSTMTLCALYLSETQTSTQIGQARKFEGVARFGLTADFGEAGSYDATSMRPRLSLVLHKPDQVTGDGYRVYVRGPEDLRVVASCNSGAVNSTARHTVFADDLERLTIEMAYGTFVRALGRSCQNIVMRFPAGTGAYAPIGDEVRGADPFVQPHTWTARQTFTGFLSFGAGTSITISGDAITATTTRILVDTEGGAATDNLATINGGSDGDIVILSTASSSRDVIVKHGTGNIFLSGAADRTLSHRLDTLFLRCVGGTQWAEMSFGDDA